MVDVGSKEPSRRRALARGRVLMSAEVARAVQRGAVGKGDVLAVARVAGIQAAKRTSELVPLCHGLMISSVQVNFEIGEDSVGIEASVETVERTGVEMEALTAVSVAALTIYDMCKALDRSMTIGDIALWEKSGGRSGTYRRAAAHDLATHDPAVQSAATHAPATQSVAIHDPATESAATRDPANQDVADQEMTSVAAGT